MAKLLVLKRFTDVKRIAKRQAGDIFEEQDNKRVQELLDNPEKIVRLANSSEGKEQGLEGNEASMQETTTEPTSPESSPKASESEPVSTPKVEPIKEEKSSIPQVKKNNGKRKQSRKRK